MLNRSDCFCVVARGMVMLGGVVSGVFQKRWPWLLKAGQLRGWKAAVDYDRAGSWPEGQVGEVQLMTSTDLVVGMYSMYTRAGGSHVKSLRWWTSGQLGDSSIRGLTLSRTLLEGMVINNRGKEGMTNG